jgi:DNA-binding CsgD family transcriptional regulator
MNNSDDIVSKLDVLIRLKVMELCMNKTQKEKIQILDSAGLPPKQIADLIGTTPNTVSVALVGLRKERKKAVGAQI